MLFGKVIKGGIRLTLALLLGLVLVGFLPIPVQAQNPVDLELGGEGALSWNIVNIKPGDSGTKTVTLHNAGSKDGFVTIWVSDIVSSEGANPESETGDTTEPGELDDYLVFGLSCDKLSTNLSLPVTIDNLPQSASDSNYIKVSPLNDGDTLNLDWNWELPPQVGNDVQGDGLSFTINYLLEEFPSRPPRATEDDGDTPTNFLEIVTLDSITWLEIETDGTICQSYKAADLHGNFSLEINRGTKVTCGNNKVPTRLVVTITEESLPTPDDTVIISSVYSFIAYIGSMACFPVYFDPPIILTLSYDQEKLPENTSSVFIGYYDDEQGFTRLQPLAGSVAEVGKVKVEVSHLSAFAVIAELAPPPPPPSLLPPPNFQVGDLIISPNQAQPGQLITISLTVTNSGGTMGNYQLQLRIDGAVIVVREVTLDPKNSETISFGVSELAAGEHQVEIAGLTGEFSIVSLPGESAMDWLLLGWATATVVSIGTPVLLFRRRKNGGHTNSTAKKLDSSQDLRKR